MVSELSTESMCVHVLCDGVKWTQDFSLAKGTKRQGGESVTDVTREEKKRTARGKVDIIELLL